MLIYKTKDSFRQALNAVCHSCKKKERYIEVKDDVIRLSAEGKSVREVCEILGISINKARNVIKTYNIQFKRTRFDPITGEDGKRICRLCGTKFEKSNVRRTKCGRCTRQGTNENFTLERFLHKRLWKIKDKCDKNGIACDLTDEFVFDLYQEQAGKCFYTDYEMSTKYGKGNSRNQLSFDRIFPDGGYTRDNVVLCTFQANAIKQDISFAEFRMWMPSWYNRVVRKFSELEVNDVEPEAA